MKRDESAILRYLTPSSAPYPIIASEYFSQEGKEFAELRCAASLVSLLTCLSHCYRLADSDLVQTDSVISYPFRLSVSRFRDKTCPPSNIRSLDGDEGGRGRGRIEHPACNAASDFLSPKETNQQTNICAFCPNAALARRFTLACPAFLEFSSRRRPLFPIIFNDRLYVQDDSLP